MPSFIEELKQVFLGDILIDEESLKKYSRDASLLEVKPSIVVAPKNTDDIKELVALLNRKNAEGGTRYSLSARSGGTDMTGGPLTESIVVDLNKYINSVKEVGDGYAITEPGVFYRDFDAKTLEKGQFLPTFPASRQICTVGGMVANNSGGEKTLTYGKTENFVEHVKMILRDGNEYTFKPLSLAELEEKKKLTTLEGDIYRKMHALVENNYDALKEAQPHVSKNSAGYFLWNVLDKEKGIFDVTKVITGSQGTLGIMTEIKFRLVKPKNETRLLIAYLKDMKEVAHVALAVLKHKPESFESFDDHTFNISMRLLPGMIKKMKGNFITLAFSFLPDLWMMVTGGIPKLVLLAEFTGDTGDEAYEKAFAAQKEIESFHMKTKVTRSAKEGERYWVMRRESFNLLRQHVHGKRTAPCIDDIIVRPDQMPEFLPKVYAILNQYDIIYTVAGHVGDGNFHIIPLMDFHKERSKQIVAELSEKIFSLVGEFKGSITAEHNDGIIRTPYLHYMFNDHIRGLFLEAKNIFDPDRIFNPGKKVEGSLQYTFDHIKIEQE